MLSFFGSKKVLAIDIGTSSIKFVELNVKKTSAELVGFHSIPLPNQVISNAEILNQAILASALQQGLAQMATKRKKVATSLWGTSVIVKKISIPKIEAKLISEQLKWEAEQYVPFDINAVTLEHHLLTASSSPENMDVLLIAAQNETIKQFKHLFSQAGLDLSIIEVSGFSLANCFEFNYGKALGQTICLINIGAAVTNFVVVQNGETVFVRDIPVGGLSYTNEISKELGVTHDEAEALKLSASRGEGVPEEVLSIMSAVSESFSEELRNSFDFFTATFSQTAISRVYYTGGGSLLPGLIKIIESLISLPFESFNPIGQIKVNAKIAPKVQAQLPLISIAMGLGLRSVGDRHD